MNYLGSLSTEDPLSTMSDLQDQEMAEIITDASIHTGSRYNLKKLIIG